MKLDPETVSPAAVYNAMVAAITPRPIAWVSTISENGVTNLAPYSYFNGVCSKPAALMFSPVNRPDGSKKDTVRNIEANGQFVVNVVPYSVAQAMGKSAGDFDYEESEFAIADLTEKPSVKVRPPGVAESPIQFECELMQFVKLGEGPLAANVVFGKILMMHFDDSIVDENGHIDPNLIDTIGRMGGKAYCRTTERFDLERG